MALTTHITLIILTHFTTIIRVPSNHILPIKLLLDQPILKEPTLKVLTLKELILKQLTLKLVSHPRAIPLKLTMTLTMFRLKLIKAIKQLHKPILCMINNNSQQVKSTTMTNLSPLNNSQTTHLKLQNTHSSKSSCLMNTDNQDPMDILTMILVKLTNLRLRTEIFAKTKIKKC